MINRVGEKHGKASFYVVIGVEEGSPKALGKAGKAEAERGGVKRVGRTGDQVRGLRPQDPCFHESLCLSGSL